MISINKFDKFENQNEASDSNEKDANADEFSVLLAAFAPVSNAQKLSEKTENSESSQTVDLITESVNENGKILTSEISANPFPNEELKETDIFADSKIVLPNGDKLPVENAFGQTNLREIFDYPANSAIEKEISETTGVKPVAEKSFEIISGKITSPFEMMPVWVKQGFVNTKAAENANRDYLPKIFRSITETAQENDAPTAPVFAPSSTNAETSKIKPLKIQASDILMQSFPQLETGAKKPKPNATADDFGARSLNDLPASITNFSKTVKLAPLNPADGEKVFDQVAANLHEGIIIFAAKPEKTNILKLRLRPAELGAVEIKLEKTDSGKLNAFFQTETDATREVLVEHIEQLREALQNSGWEIEKLDISRGSSFSAGNESRENQSRQTENVGSDLPKDKLNEDVSENDSSANRLVSLRA